MSHIVRILDYLTSLNRSVRALGLTMILASILVSTSGDAAVPGLISYQGRLTNSAGTPVADGTYLVKFQIYDNAVGGSILWNSNYQSVPVKIGVYTYVLGQDVPFPNGLFSGGNRWLGITVGVDPELTPRKQMIATSYAFVSQNADSTSWGGIKNIPAGFADGIDDNSGDITAVNTSGGIAGGVTSGDANLSLASGGVTSTHIGDGQIVNADISPSAAIDPTKISGSAASLTANQTFTGKNTFSDSVKFIDNTMQVSNGQVLIGKSAALPSYGFLRIDRADNTNLGITGGRIELSNSGGGYIQGLMVGAYGTTGNTTGIYVIARSNDDARRGALITTFTPTNNLSTGTSYGVQSEAYDGAWVYGLFGRSWRGVEGRGVYGEARLASYQGVGVHGYAFQNPNYGLGIAGQATQNVVGWGVYGEAWDNTVEQYAGYFVGNVNVTGTIFTPASASRIDHPFDPENKYLQHANVQSPDMINVYTGNVSTDGNGDATVIMPVYFSAINGDFRYQLTVIGQFAQAIIAEKIAGNLFKIKTDRPNVEVSWQVTGIRQDLFSKANHIETEVDKSPREVGKYLHPEVYGFGPEKRTTYEIREALLKASAESGRGREENKR